MVVLGVIEEFPQFGEVLEVYVAGTNRVLLYTRILDTHDFSQHYHAYVVQRSSSFKVVTPDDLYTPSLLHLRHLSINGSTKLVTITKYHVCYSL